MDTSAATDRGVKLPQAFPDLTLAVDELLG